MQMSHYKNTTFVSVMGNMDLNALSTTFQTFFPVLLLPFILMTLFDVYSRILNLLRIKRFQFTDDFNHSLIEEGQEILAEERERLGRGVTDDDASLKDEREAAATARHTNTRGVQFDARDSDIDSEPVSIIKKIILTILF